MKFKIGQIVRIGQSTLYGKITGFSKDKQYYKIQWLSPSKPPSKIKISNNNLRLDDH